MTWIKHYCYSDYKLPSVKILSTRVKLNKVKQLLILQCTGETTWVLLPPLQWGVCRKWSSAVCGHVQRVFWHITQSAALQSQRWAAAARLARWQHLLDAIMCWEAPWGPHPPQSAPSRACWQLGVPPCAAVLPSCSRTLSTVAQKPPPTPPPVCSLSPSQASAMLPPPRLQIQFLTWHLPAEAFSRKGGISPTLF